MDQKTVNTLEREIENCIAAIMIRMGLKHLPLLPSQATMRQMAKAAFAVYELAVEDETRPPMNEHPKE